MATCPKCSTTYAAKERMCPKDGTVLEDEKSTEERQIGRTLDGKYRLDSFLSHGGMGAVYRATHVMLGKEIAVKIIKPELAPTPEVVRRFQREARAASHLNHPNIVGVYDLGQAEDGTLYIAMELVPGASLKEVIRKGGPMEPARITSILRQVVSALSLAHKAGVVHRDLKPHNIVMCTDRGGAEVAKLLDFGIAKTFEVDAGTQLTQTGSVLGTPQYMSPEQASGKEVDGRSDLYSLGVILYEMLVGEVPFNDPSATAILVKHLTEAPPVPSRKRPDIAISPRLERIALRLLEKDPASRYATADELAMAVAGADEPAAAREGTATVAAAAGSMPVATQEDGSPTMSLGATPLVRGAVASAVTPASQAPVSAASSASLAATPMAAAPGPAASGTPATAGSTTGTHGTSPAKAPAPVRTAAEASDVTSATRPTARKGARGLAAPETSAITPITPSRGRDAAIAAVAVALGLVLLVGLGLIGYKLGLFGGSAASAESTSAPAAASAPADAKLGAAGDVPRGAPAMASGESVPAPVLPPAALLDGGAAGSGHAGGATTTRPGDVAPVEAGSAGSGLAVVSTDLPVEPANLPPGAVVTTREGSVVTTREGSAAVTRERAPAVPREPEAPPLVAQAGREDTAPRRLREAVAERAAARRGEREPVSRPPEPAAPASAPLPADPPVLFRCQGPPEICSALKHAVDEALERAGLPSVRLAARAEVVIDAQVEVGEERVEQQFGTTFNVRQYAIDLSAEAPRFGDSVSMPAAEPISVDLRVGRERIAERSRVLASNLADKVRAYWKRKTG